MWHAVEGFEKRKKNGKLVRYFINDQRVPETTFKRKYVAELEAENAILHAKLAQIYDVI